MLDHEKTKEIDSMATLCLDQLKSVQDKHGEGVSTIRNEAEKRLVKDYLVCMLSFEMEIWKILCSL